MSIKNGQYKFCSKCSEEYYIRANRAKASKYCSECWKQRNPPEVRQCKQCAIGFVTYERKTKSFCSMNCRDMYTSLHRRGELSNGWKDGKSLERERARQGRPLKEWKKAVKQRDNHTCQHCGCEDELHAHHIIEWAKDENQRFVVSNGLTLCIDCHGKVHGKNFRRNNRNKSEINAI